MPPSPATPPAQSKNGQGYGGGCGDRIGGRGHHCRAGTGHEICFRLNGAVRGSSTKGKTGLYTQLGSFNRQAHLRCSNLFSEGRARRCYPNIGPDGIVQLDGIQRSGSQSCGAVEIHPINVLTVPLSALAYRS